MDRRERTERFQLALKAILQGYAATVWTACPGIVESYDAATNTAEVKLAIRPKQRSPEGVWTDVDTPPLLVDVPVKFFGNAKFVVTIPVTKGDEGIIVFSKNCFDAWWQSGGVQSQLELRTHDLSDAFFLPGVYSKPNVPAAISTTSMQMRNLAGDTYVEVKNGQLVNIVAPGGVNINGVTIDTHGNVVVPGTLSTGDETDLAGGAKKVVLDGDAVVAGHVVASSTKTKAT